MEAFPHIIEPENENKYILKYETLEKGFYPDLYNEKVHQEKDQ